MLLFGTSYRWLPRQTAWRVVLLAAPLFMARAAHAQPTDLIISQYLEGSTGTNKYIELYNGTGASINLADYDLRLYTNGSPTPSQTATLTGTLASGTTIVYGNSAGTLFPAFTALDAICNFNGDDAVVLWNNQTTSYVDIFGNISVDPGTAWTSGSLSTANQSLVRNPNICSGVTVNPSGSGPTSFTTLGSEWTNAGTDNVSGLGSHTMTCGPTVNFNTATGSALENTGPATV
ncbi:MAG: lamin tail domain-containing protein, partial [Flavobacteriales bacterium]|nr:lamin tail domain-containing protein [Flavobacteriales bacterium]